MLVTLQAFQMSWLEGWHRHWLVASAAVTAVAAYRWWQVLMRSLVAAVLELQGLAMPQLMAHLPCWSLQKLGLQSRIVDDERQSCRT